MQKEPVYADLHPSTNPPAPPLPVQPVRYATVKAQTATKDKDTGKIYVYVDLLQCSTNPSAAPLPTQNGNSVLFPKFRLILLPLGDIDHVPVDDINKNIAYTTETHNITK